MKEKKFNFSLMPLIVVAIVCFLFGSQYTSDKESKINEQIRSQYAELAIKKDANGNQVKEYQLKNPQTGSTEETKEQVEEPVKEEPVKEVPKVETPKQEIPKQEVPKQETKPVEQPKSTEPVHDVHSGTCNIDNGNYLVIGGIELGTPFNQAHKHYENYYMYTDPYKQSYYNNDKNGYGDFLLTIQTDQNDKVTRIAYNKFSISKNPKNVPIINIGDIQTGASIERIKEVYGDWDQLNEQNDVKTLVYYNFSYGGRPVILMFYIDRNTQTVYGYEVAFV